MAKSKTKLPVTTKRQGKKQAKKQASSGFKKAEKGHRVPNPRY